MTANAARDGRLALFFALTLGFSGFFYYRILSSGSLAAGGGAAVLGLMWSPGAAALLTTLIHQRDLRGLGWAWGGTRYQLWSWAIPILYAGTAYLVVWATGLGGFYDPQTAERLVERLGERFGLGGLSPAAAVALYIPLALLINLPFECFAALGEEIGWRGFLVPRLFRRFGFTGTSLLSGGVWAVWHYPLLLFADYHGGTPRWYSLACFSVMVVGISFAYSWLRLRSGSVWTAMLLHGSHNLVVQRILDPLTADTGPTRWVIGEFGIALAVSGALVGYVFWRRASVLGEAGQARAG